MATKTLYLLRHAKSDRSDGAIEDFDRPLAARGRRDAPALGEYMRAHGYRPDLILCSAAKRTRETLALLETAFDAEIPTKFDRKLYLASAESMIQRLQEVADKVSSVLMVGHNPGIERLAAGLAGRGDRHALARMREKYPTSGLAVIVLHIDRWQQIGFGTGTLTDFMIPAGLPGDD